MIRTGSQGAEAAAEAKYYIASQWQLMWHKFRRHRLALIGGGTLTLLYLCALFSDFVIPYDVFRRFPDAVFHPPSKVRFVDHHGRFHLVPFVYGIASEQDPVTFATRFTEDVSARFPIRLFARGDEYRLLGLVPMRIHLFGVAEPGALYLFGTDDLGRDLFSRTLYAARVSLSIGLLGVAVTFLIGSVLGAISGYYGGRVDMFIQRVIEFLISIPTIPLWMGLAAALPQNWPPLRVYFGIVIILSLVGWGGLARVVRGKLLELRELDFTMAARIAGMKEFTIIRAPPAALVCQLPDREPHPAHPRYDPVRDRAELSRPGTAVAGGDRAAQEGAEHPEHRHLSWHPALFVIAARLQLR